MTPPTVSEITDAPPWLERAVRGRTCAGCGAANPRYCGVFLRPRRYPLAYAVCTLCASDFEHVAEKVERRVEALELVRCCTTPGGAA